MRYFEYLQQAEKINKNTNVNKLILVNLFNKDLTWLYANLNLVSNKDNLQKYLNLVKKYAEGYPLGYILGYVFFASHKILVDERVLIPRDETQYLVEEVLKISKQYFSNKNLKALDLATGSGCIAITLGFNKNFTIIASDISYDALEVAKKNINFNKLKNIQLVYSNLFENLKNQKFDIIISNPPYIDQFSETYDQEKLNHEPEIALFAKNKGLFFYQQIFSQILNYVNKKFLLAFEFGFDQKSELEKLIKELLPKNINYYFIKDINNHWRYLFIKG